MLGGLNPSQRVPTLVLDDGRPLGEPNAILWYFGDGTRFVPEDRYERAQVLQWQFFDPYDHEPCVTVARNWMSYRGTPVDPAAPAAISLCAYTQVSHEDGFDLGRYPAIRAWLGRVALQPGHVAVDAQTRGLPLPQQRPSLGA